MTQTRLATIANHRVRVDVSRPGRPAIRKEIAVRDRKRAVELRAVAKEEADVNRISASITRSAGQTMLPSKLREIDRKRRKAAEHATKAAKLGDEIANKQRSLTTAEKNLGRALASQQAKQDREARRRRQADIDHLRRLERERRQLDAPFERQATLRVVREPARSGSFEYDVCLSFAGEDRPYVEIVAAGLKARGLKVFYDHNEPVTLWGKDLASTSTTSTGAPLVTA